MNLDKYLMLSWKRFLIILGVWLGVVVAHNLLSSLLGYEEFVIFAIAIFLIPFYFLISFIYSIFFFMKERTKRRLK